jgi:hypothetical protein
MKGMLAFWGGNQAWGSLRSRLILFSADPDLSKGLPRSTKSIQFLVRPCVEVVCF